MHFRATKSTQELPSRLPDDGTLTSETWECIVYRIENLKNALVDLGFDGVDDPIQQHVRFSTLVKQFQTSIDMLPDGLLSQKTIQALVFKWKSDSSIST